MADTQNLIYGVTGQVIAYRAEYRASSVTSVQVFAMDAGDDDTVEFTPTGVVETSPNTTTDAITTAAAPRNIPVTATTGCEIGREYRIIGADNESEMFLVTEIESGASLTTAAPLKHIYASGSTVHSTYIEFTVDATWVADDTKISDDLDPNPGYRVRWSFVATPPGGASTAYVEDSYLNLVRYDAGHGVTPNDMENFMPGFLDILPENHQRDRGVRIIGSAWQQVRWDLQQSGVPAEMIRNREGTAELVKARAAYAVQTSRLTIGQAADSTVELYRLEYQSRLDQLARRANNLTMATSTDGSGRRVTAQNLWSR